MFEKFTERARKVMSVARQEAQRLNAEFIGTEHILLGIASDGNGIGGTVLKKLTIEAKAIQAEIAKIVIPIGQPSITLGQLPFSPRAKRVIEMAGEEADRRGSNVISTGHVLLGVHLENEGIGSQVLKNLGVDSDRLRAEITVLDPTEERQGIPHVGPDPTQTSLKVRLLREVAQPEDAEPYIVVNGCFYQETQTIILAGIMSEKAFVMAKLVAAQHGASSYIVEPVER